jgi:hypothetical protein
VADYEGAEFFCLDGDKDEWLGSVASGGDEWARTDCLLMQAKTEQEFRSAVGSISLQRTDFSDPEHGGIDDGKAGYTYAFRDGQTQAFYFGDVRRKQAAEKNGIE